MGKHGTIRLNEALEAVDRLAAAGSVTTGSRAMRLLTYLVTEESQGRGGAIKAYAIAVDVLGRGTDFDPGQDSIVRVEIGRLRRALAAYYAGAGASDPLIIEIPTGQSRPVITRKAPDAGPGFTGLAQRVTRSHWARIGAALAVAFALGMAGTALWQSARLAPRADPSGKATPPIVTAQAPIIEVHRFELADGDPDLRFLATGLRAQMVRQLSQFRTLRVRDNRDGIDTSHLPQARYDLRGLVHVVAGAPLLELSLVDTASGTVKWAGQLRADVNDPTFPARFQDRLTTLILAIAAPSGIVAAEERALLDPPAGTSDPALASRYACHLRWHAWDETKDPVLKPPLRACLEHWTGAGTDDGAIWGAYGFLTFLDWAAAGGDPDDPHLAQAEAAARKGVQLSPTDADTHEALGSILMATGRNRAARAAFQRAHELNPSKPDITVLLGWQAAMSDDWEDGIALVREGIGMALSVPGWFRIPLALDAFRRGDYRAALAEAELMIEAGDGRGQVLALAAALAGNDNAAEARYRGTLAQAGRSPAQALDEIAAVFDNAEVIAALSASLKRDPEN